MSCDVEFFILFLLDNVLIETFYMSYVLFFYVLLRLNPSKSIS